VDDDVSLQIDVPDCGDMDALLSQPVIYGKKWFPLVRHEEWLASAVEDEAIPYPATARLLMAGFRGIDPTGDTAREHAMTMYGERARTLFPNLFPASAGPRYLMGIEYVLPRLRLLARRYGRLHAFPDARP